MVSLLYSTVLSTALFPGLFFGVAPSDPSGTAFTPVGWHPRSVSAAGQLEIIADLPQRPGNPAISPDGRIFLSLHPFEDPEFKVVELQPDGSTKPFPNAEWARSPEPGRDEGLAGVIGIECDRNGLLWMLDLGGPQQPFAKLVAWNLKTDKLDRVLRIEAPVFRPDSYMQDFAIDLSHGAAYIADPTRPGEDAAPAIVVVDLHSGRARRVLEKHACLQPDAGEVLPRSGGRLSDLGLDPITLDADDAWVYFGALKGGTLWRVRTRALLDEELGVEKLAEHVERVGSKPPCDGISIDGKGNVYVTSIVENAIGVVRPDGEYVELVRDDKYLIWPDGLSYGPDGYFYVTTNQLQLHPRLNDGTEASDPPYHLVRFKSLAPGILGR